MRGEIFAAKPKKSEAGKGDSPRPINDPSGYSNNYETIFGKRSLQDFKKIMSADESAQLRKDMLDGI